MAYGPRQCAVDGSTVSVEEHHLNDDMTIWLCKDCHGRTHGMRHRGHIGRLTKEGLARKKIELARVGKKLGNPDPVVFARARRAGQIANREKADAFAAQMLPLISRIRSSGIGNTLRDLAAVLNASKVPTARGGKWYTSTVRSLLERQNKMVLFN